MVRKHDAEEEDDALERMLSGGELSSEEAAFSLKSDFMVAL